MSTMKFTSEHEWLRFEDDSSAALGITDYAQDQLGDIVYVELPEPGASFEPAQQIMVIESVKAVGEINAPLACRVTAVNERLAEEPELVNSDPLGDGWLIKVEVDGDKAALLDEAAYESLVESLQ